MPRPKKEDFETEEILTRIKGWAMDGLTNEQIATNLGISSKSLFRWARDENSPDGLGPIGRVLKISKEVADREVENALFKSAKGYDTEEVTELWKNGVLISREVKVKHIPPSNAAQIFWLKNRKPDIWRDVRKVEDKVEFENDGFIDALKGQVEDTFKDIENDVEE